MWQGAGVLSSQLSLQMSSGFLLRKRGSQEFWEKLEDWMMNGLFLISDRVLSGTCNMIQGGLELVAILLSHRPNCWDYRCKPLHQADLIYLLLLHFNPSSGCLPTPTSRISTGTLRGERTQLSWQLSTLPGPMEEKAGGRKKDNVLSW